jgi:FxsC-like protein
MDDDFLFFVSYARNSYNPYMQAFVDDLVQAVFERIPHPRERVAFFDGQSIEPGMDWDGRLLDGLQRSRVLLCLYSPHYFTREFCGKEWGFFRLRQEEYRRARGTDERPPVVVPVLWLPPGRVEQLPAVAREAQFAFPEFGAAYHEEGVRELVSLNEYRDEYRRVVRRLAELIIERGSEHPLPPLSGFRTAAEIPNVFAGEPQPLPDGGGDPPAPGALPPSGPRYVDFVYVAARQDEVRPLTGHYPELPVDAYGELGELDWRPFLPSSRAVVAQLASEVTFQEEFVADRLPFSPDLLDRLTEAGSRNKIVVLVVDPWTLAVEPYRERMREYDGRRFHNTVVLVPWGDRSRESRPVLEEQLLESTFPLLTNPRNPEEFVDDISSPEEFRQALAAALHRVKMRILRAARVVRRAPGNVARPMLEGPGGRS